jgi:hypothetical protein
MREHAKSVVDIQKYQNLIQSKMGKEHDPKQYHELWDDENVLEF